MLQVRNSKEQESKHIYYSLQLQSDVQEKGTIEFGGFLDKGEDIVVQQGLLLSGELTMIIVFLLCFIVMDGWVVITCNGYINYKKCYNKKGRKTQTA